MNPTKIDSYGNKYWYNERGDYHRVDGPAKEFIDGSKYWYYHGKKHRVDGPAIEFLDGHESWYYHGERIHCKNNEEYLKIIKLRMFW